MAKDKKKKKDNYKKPPKSSSALKALAGNPLVADVVAAALVATAAALKDSKRARALAADAGDELAKLSKSGARSGEALWEMALQIGRRSVEAMSARNQKSKSPKAKVKSRPAKKARKDTATASVGR